ncbi:MAG: hypothetical protein CM1200mP10_11440 [Candidatus Neomarinimicrobiota bacterium]|nr:MAG: hypothetical protein CM1200mP10_11440 [Candidatus Neomarinimicrobiota bacterium]
MILFLRHGSTESILKIVVVLRSQFAGSRKLLDIFSPSWQLIIPENPLFLGNTVKELKNNGFPVIPWTINRTKIMEKVILQGVDGIILIIRIVC